MASLTFLVGLPGSGKDYYCDKHFRKSFDLFHNYIVLSSDEIRAEIGNGESDQSKNKEVFQILKERAIENLKLERDVVINATNINRKRRVEFINQMIKGCPFFWDMSIKFIVIATPYYKCLENNRKRSRQVPDNVIERMYKNFEFPLESEGDGAIVEVVYPFGVDKERYSIKPPYEPFLLWSHENPHHLLSIGGHMEKAAKIMKSITTDRVLVGAAALHDIGKPFCKFFKEGDSNAHYYNHENVGSYEAMFYGKMWNMPKEDLIRMCSLINLHMKPYFCKGDEELFKQLRWEIGDEMFYQLMTLHFADKEAHY